MVVAMIKLFEMAKNSKDGLVLISISDPIKKDSTPPIANIP